MRSRETIAVRDPIHGSIHLTPREFAIVEHPVFQRLRGIKQLGFADLAFPGATHSRFSHGLGAMEMASRMFDAIFPADKGPVSAQERRRMRQIVRLAVLLHDVGHAPLSHATEGCMPPLIDLRPELAAESKRQATHEDYTVHLMLRSSLRQALGENFAGDGITVGQLVALISGELGAVRGDLSVGGIDYSPLLRQIVSGELDADRMDYLQRDSYYAGVNYGKVDAQWLLDNLGYHVVHDRALMSLSHRAIFAFEDFLLSRFHMFVSVYYHHTSVGLDTMLAWFIEEEPDTFVLPVDPESYVELDDVVFWSKLRASRNRWARRIVSRKLYARIVELHTEEGLKELGTLCADLDQAGIDYFISRDEGVLSRYYAADFVGDPIYVSNRGLGRVTRVDNYSKLFSRYRQPTRLTRLYCRPDQLAAAKACLARHRPRQQDLAL